MKESTTTLSDKDLADRCDFLIRDFCKNGNKSKLWYMSIPARPNEDADLVFSELISRFEQLQTENKELRDKLKDLYENRFEPDKLHIKLERLKSIGD